MSKIGVAVVGLGGIAQRAHLPVLAVHPDVEIVALASRTGAHIGTLSSRYRLNLKATTFEQILELKPSAAYLLSATAAHPEQAVALLEAGIAVYMEKPLANDLDGARRIADAAAAPGRLLMVGFNRRYAPAYRRARALFSGRTPELIQIHKHRNGSHAGWDLRQAVMDDAIHIIDLARYFGGEVAVRTAVCRPGLTAVQLATGAGAVVQISQTYGAGAPTERVELHGGGLTVIVDEMEQLRVRENGQERSEVLFGAWATTLEKRGMAGATEHFLQCVRSGAQPETTAADALLTQELAEVILAGGAG